MNKMLRIPVNAALKLHAQGINIWDEQQMRDPEVFAIVTRVADEAVAFRESARAYIDQLNQQSSQ